VSSVVPFEANRSLSQLC